MDDWSNNRLDSWKEIAGYLRRDVKTALRWEKEKGLPVHRMSGGKRHAVYAYKTEIEAWLGNGSPQVTAEVEAGKVANGTAVVTGNGDHISRHPEPQGNVAARRPKNQLWQIAAGAAILAILVYQLIFSSSTPVVFSYQQLTNDGYFKSGLLTDGSRVYFVEATPSGNVIAQVPAAGGDVMPVSRFFANPSLLAINAERSEIIVSERPNVTSGALWLLSLDGGAPQRVGTINSNAAAWSVDGSTIAYSKGRELWLCRVDGSEDHKIATLPRTINWISWQRDSNLLRITLDYSGHGPPVMQVGDDGSNLKAVDDGWGITNGWQHGKWGPDDEFLLQSSGPAGSINTLWLFSEQPWFSWRRGFHGVKVGIGPLSIQDFAPSTNAGTVFVNAVNSRCQFERYNLRDRAFVPYLSGVSGDELNFSPDGKFVAYVEEPECALMAERLNAGSPVQLTLPPMDTELPRWSPDGKWIAFMGRKNSFQTWHVYVIHANGGEPYRVTKGNQPEGAPTWSPDGTRLAFGEIGEPAGPPDIQSHIHILDLKTGRESVLPGSKGLWTARWSPNGELVAALSVDLHSLLVYSFQTRKWKELAEGKAIGDLDWSKDGKVIYFLDGMGPNGMTIFKVSLLRNGAEQVASLNDLESTSGWLGLTPDDAPLVSRQESSSEVYAIHWRMP